MRKLGYLLLVGLSLAAGVEAQPTSQLVVERRSATPAPIMPQIGPTNPGWMAAHFVNVGQGSGAVLEFSCGVVVVDTGGGGMVSGHDWTERFGTYLDQVFQRRADLDRTVNVVFLTHPHVDHTRGAALLTDENRFRVRHVVTNAQTAGSGFDEQRPLADFADQRQIRTQARISNIPAPDGLTTPQTNPLACVGNAPFVRVLWGSHDQPPRWTAVRDGNNHSVVIRVDFGESSILITGDLEEPAQQALLQRYAGNPGILDADVYLAGHHGSRNGTIPDLVQAVTPELAVISAGDPSDRESGFSAFNFGHPNRLAISRLSDPTFGVTMRRPPRRVAVGHRGRNPKTRAPPIFGIRTIRRAIFSTGWDGDVVVYARTNGEKRVAID